MAFNGEVEDYDWGFSPTSIHLAQFSALPARTWFTPGIFLVVGILASAGLLLLGRRSLSAK